METNITGDRRRTGRIFSCFGYLALGILLLLLMGREFVISERLDAALHWTDNLMIVIAALYCVASFGLALYPADLGKLSAKRSFWAAFLAPAATVGILLQLFS